MCHRYGIIPNGGRIYYLNRSQPPLLAPMMYEYFKATNDTDFIRENIALLEKEYKWWMENRIVEVFCLLFMNSLRPHSRVLVPNMLGVVIVHTHFDDDYIYPYLFVLGLNKENSLQSKQVLCADRQTQTRGVCPRR